MPAHPLKPRPHTALLGIQQHPQITIWNSFALLHPIAPLPSVFPNSQPVHAILRVAKNRRFGAVRQLLHGAQDRGQLHPVIGGDLLRSPFLLPIAVMPCPATCAWVGIARAVSPYLFHHNPSNALRERAERWRKKPLPIPLNGGVSFPTRRPSVNRFRFGISRFPTSALQNLLSLRWQRRPQSGSPFASIPRIEPSGAKWQLHRPRLGILLCAYVTGQNVVGFRLGTPLYAVLPVLAFEPFTDRLRSRLIGINIAYASPSTSCTRPSGRASGDRHWRQSQPCRSCSTAALHQSLHARQHRSCRCRRRRICGP